MANDTYLAQIKKPKYLTDELIRTIDLIAQARDSELSFDKTIIAEIVSLNNAETGEYYVSYQQGKFKAYAPTNLNYVYNEGVSVYVKIPGGDFSAKKLIEGKASSTTATEEEYDFMSSNIVEMGYGFQDTNNTYSILAGAQPDEQHYEKVIFENITNTEDAAFYSTFLAYPVIKLSADFKTDFKGDPISGNYGLKVEFYTDKKNDDGSLITYTRKLEIANFVGSLHEYLTFSPQYAVYKVDNVNLTALKKITFFQERYIEYDNLKDLNGNIIYENKTEPNIFINNIKVSFVDDIDNTESLYYCGIQAIDGLSLIQETDTIKLEGKFYYALKDIMNAANCQCFWFKQNPKIVPGHELYNQHAGGGWEEITDKNKVDFNVLTLKGSDVYQQLRIKLVVLYNTVMTFSSEVRVVKYYNSRYGIIKTTDSSGTYLTLIDGKGTIDTADWYISLPDGSYYQYASDTNMINISEFLIYPEIFVELAITIEDDKVIPYDYKLTNVLLDSDIRVTYSGVDTFLYDANGDITYSEYEKEIIIKPIINTSASTVVTSITWYGPTGVALYEVRQSPNNSMMKNIWVDSTNAIHFIIYPKFFSTKMQNTFQLKIETSSGNTYYYNKTINFIKEGNQETNGLTYTIVVNYSDKDGQEISKTPLLYKRKKWSNEIYLHPKVYIDGKLVYNNFKIDDNRIYNIIYTVQPIHINAEQIVLGANDYLYKISGKEIHDQGQYFVRFVVTVKVMNGEKEESSSVINYYEPIMVAYGDIILDQLTNLAIPDRITYTANGDTPSYSSSYITANYKGISQTSLNKPISLNDNIFISYLNYTDGTINYYIYPAQTYTGANFPLDESGEEEIPMGAIKIYISGVSQSYIVQPVVMLLANETSKGIKGYSGGVINVVDENNNNETTKPVKPIWGSGSVSLDEDSNIDDVFTNGMMFAQEILSSITGIFGYDRDGNPSNTIKSDGSFSLGSGSINMSYDDEGNSRYSFGDGFISALKGMLGL